MIEFTVQPSFDDYEAANRLVRRTAWAPRKLIKPALTIAFFAAIGSFLVSMGETAPWQERLTTSLVIGVIGALVWLPLCYALGSFKLRSQVRKTFDELGTVSLQTHYRFTGQGMEADYEEGSSRHGWSRFHDYLLDDRLLLLRRTAGMFFLIPVVQLDEATRNQLSDLLAQSGVKRS